MFSGRQKMLLVSVLLFYSIYDILVSYQEHRIFLSALGLSKLKNLVRTASEQKKFGKNNFLWTPKLQDCPFLHMIR
jgi:hypothetical protein